MNTLVKLDPKEFGLTENKAKEVSAMFQPMLDKMVELENEYNALIESIEGEPTEDDCRSAKELRLKYVKVRTGTEAIHKELKAFYLSGGRFVDGWKNAQKMASQGIEERLKEIETHQERKEAERKTALEASRRWELSEYTDQIPSGLGDMPESVWEMYLTGAKKAHADKIEAERKAEEERQRQEAELAKGDDQVMADLHSDIRGLIIKYNNRFKSTGYRNAWARVHVDLVRAYDKAESMISETEFKK